MTDVLTADELRSALDDRVEGWTGTPGEGIAKTYERGDFAGAMRFVNAVADIAERRDHHPDIAISWATVTLTIVSHSAGGVTAQCLALAEAIDAEAT
jgi:4a-hydroxytetrahydrobiopterin dehydratase